MFIRFNVHEAECGEYKTRRKAKQEILVGGLEKDKAMFVALAVKT